jgi:hypothetical protein
VPKKVQVFLSCELQVPLLLLRVLVFLLLLSIVLFLLSLLLLRESE